MYIIQTYEEIVLKEKYENVLNYLHELCKLWLYDSEDEECENEEELFNYCFKNKDFGDIAHVYYINYENIIYDLPEDYKEYKIKRIF